MIVLSTATDPDRVVCAQLMTENDKCGVFVDGT
jgi:hypothetical protein